MLQEAPGDPRRPLGGPAAIPQKAPGGPRRPQEARGPLTIRRATITLLLQKTAEKVGNRFFGRWSFKKTAWEVFGPPGTSLDRNFGLFVQKRPPGRSFTDQKTEISAGCSKYRKSVFLKDRFFGL